MKQRLSVMAAVLLALLVWLGCAGAEGARTQDLKVQMFFSATEVKAGDTVQVMISVTNTSGRDFPEAMTLWDPTGKRIRDFGDPVLKNGETVTWFGNWCVTEKNVNDAKISFRVRYAAEQEDGTVKNKAANLIRTITPVIPDVTPEPEPTPEPTPEPVPGDFDDVVLYGVYRPNPSTGKVAVGCVDRGGNVWLAGQADVRWPALDEDVRDMLRVRRGMTKYENLVGNSADGTLMSAEWFSGDLPAMVAAVPQPAERPRKTGIDVGQEAVWGLRKNEIGEEESVLLGMAGSYMYENPSPDAQRLYLFMWRLMVNDEIFNARGVSYAAEGVSPQGFRGLSVREFFGLADGDLSKAAVSAVRQDAEGRPAEAELSREELEAVRGLAERGMVIRKENARGPQEGTLTCTFTDERGGELGRIRIFFSSAGTDEDGEPVVSALAVTEDGMYRTVLAPRPVAVLTEEELRLMTVRIEGVDYVVGKSTPRDLIRNGWNCFPEWSGTFTHKL